jgi:nucleoside-diphosphate-sugar epimerase
MILVTGGTGLVGSHLIYDLVKKGLPVRALRRKKSNINEVKKVFSYYSENSSELFSKIEWAEGDLLDIFSLAAAMEGCDQVYHCAAIVSMDPEDGERMIRNNVTGTANIVNMALEKKINKLCHVSSVASLGVENGKEIKETTAWNDESNLSAYAISKYLSENEVWRATQEGLNAVIVNPTIIIGPGNWNRSSGLIFKAANKGIRWHSTGGMGYVDVRDVVKTMLLLMDSDVINQKFIVSSENMSFRNFFELAYTALGNPNPDKKAGKLILQLAWRADKLRSLLTGSSHVFTKEVAHYAGINLAYSNKKIKEFLKMEFIPVSEAVKNASRHFLFDLGRVNK